MVDVAARISQRVAIAANGCWIWQGENVGGYGRIRVNGRKVMAHRASFEAFKEPIPEGLHVLHECDNPPCVNPAHLRCGTRSDNIRDAIEKGRKKPIVGNLVWTSRLQESDIEHIRIRVLSGETKTSVAASYGVTRQAIGHIANRRNWKHV